MNNNNNCVQVSQAIKQQGLDDVTSYALVKLLFILVYGLLFAIGLIGNGGVLAAVAQNRRLRSARNIFLLNLIITDLLLCLTAIPVTPWYALSKDWQFGAVMCRLMPLSNSCSVFVSSWSLTAIALDKFIHILDPTRAPISLGQAGAVTLIIWLVCSVINLPAMLSYELVDGSHYVAPGQPPFCGHFCDETNWTSPASRQLYGAMVMLLQFVVPMGLISYCYARILGKVHSDMIIQNAQFSASLSSAQRHEAVQRKRRVNYILIAMVFTFVGCWTPLTAVNILKDFRQEPGFLAAQPYLWPLIAHSIAMSTTISNPFLFFWLTRKQKAPRIARALVTNTTEVISSFASRVQSFKRNSMLSAHGDSGRRPGREKVDLLAIGGGE